MNDIRSMTGFASRSGSSGVLTWVWDARSVNARGYDLRLRIPDVANVLEPEIRLAFGASIKRGTVTVALRLSRAETGPGAAEVNGDKLLSALAMVEAVEARAGALGVGLTPASAADILAMPGVLGTALPESLTGDLGRALRDDIAPLLAALLAARGEEGGRQAVVLAGLIDRIEALVAEVRALLGARKAAVAAEFRAALDRVLGDAAAVGEERLAQELALIAVRQDIAEELDRLDGHVAAARALLAQVGPVGRQFDFLAQEFNREANTLCSKSHFGPLTALGLDLKSVIDQMRELVQNLE